MIEQIYSGGKLLAIIMPRDFCEEGVNFVTPHNLSQQLAFIKHPAGRSIDPHIHNPVPREVIRTQEVLLIRKGKLQVDFYDEARQYIESRILCAGDVVLFAEGGHGFQVLEEVEMVEVKQGPYAETDDKIRFDAVPATKVMR